MKIFKNKYMKNLIILVVVLFFFAEGLESLAEGKNVLAVIEFAAAAFPIGMTIKKLIDKKNGR